MKSKLLLSIFMLAGWCLKAQVTMTPFLPPLGLTIKPQLWHMSLINSSGAPVNIQLQMVMTDVGTNQPVLTAQTPIIPLAAGVQMITANDVTPITYTAAPGYVIDPGPNGFLPVGVFNVCFTLTKWTNDISEQLAEECITTEVEPLSPPQLIQPGDSDRISLRRPFFAWLPPTPINNFSNLLYDWILVEVQTTQSASDAIQQNIPLLTQPNIAFTSFQYPLSMPELDSGKIYAWRVTAKNNNVVVANSEIWSFSIQDNFIDTVSAASKGYYAKLYRSEDAAFVLCNGILRFEYKHDINAAAVDIRIFDISSNNRKPVRPDTESHPYMFGQNLVEVDLRETTGMIDKHMYLLELVNNKNERWYLKFEYRKDQE
jgi:hypothetical protein